MSYFRECFILIFFACKCATRKRTSWENFQFVVFRFARVCPDLYEILEGAYRLSDMRNSAESILECYHAGDLFSDHRRVWILKLLLERAFYLTYWTMQEVCSSDYLVVTISCDFAISNFLCCCITIDQSNCKFYLSEIYPELIRRSILGFACW